jgi:hypothetical protein
VYGDGRCFFRCLALSFYEELFEAERSESGWINESSPTCQLGSEETEKADQLRKVITDSMKKDGDYLSRASQNLPFLLDKTVVKQYASIDERLHSMSCPATFAGTLELLAAAYLLRRQIHVYQKPTTSASVHYKLVAKLPTSHFDQQPPSLLLNTEDNKCQPGHFSVLVSSATASCYKLYPLSTPLEHIIQQCVLACEHDEHLQLKDLLNEYQCEGRMPLCQYNMRFIVIY